ncbi:MAG TPA: hypothetical protein PLU58_15185, partial [Saprospiraceae bacterium]|nr:hypothetical protein [Saprospiraceae bacterium]
ETIETIRTSGLTLIISTIWFYKTFTAEFGLILHSKGNFTNYSIRSDFGVSNVTFKIFNIDGINIFNGFRNFSDCLLNGVIKTDF